MAHPAHSSGRPAVRLWQCRRACALLVAGMIVGFPAMPGPSASRATAAAAPASAPTFAPVASSVTATRAPASAATSAPVASSSASAIAAASAPASFPAQTLPAKPAASQGGVWLPPRAACVPDAADPERCGPLTLERDPIALPNANQGRPYARAIHAEGGLPPYAFDLMQGNLPAGMALDIHGRITGTPGQAGSSRFRVRVVDVVGSVASQTYGLRVFAPATPVAKPASAPASAAVQRLSQLDVNQAGPPAHAAPTARVYQLEPAQLDELKTAIKPADGASAPASGDPVVEPEAALAPATAASAPTPPVPADLVWSDAQHTQLLALLQPVLAVEYPTQSLFEAAVDAQVCAQAWQLIVHEAQRLKQLPPNQTEFAALCPTPVLPTDASRAPGTPGPSSSAPAAAASTAPTAGGAQPMSWRSLPEWLMPPGLRDWLVEAAARDRALMPTQPLPWTATPSCNCAAPRLEQPLYAVYPAWLAEAPQPQMLDFSLANRISYFALPLGDERALNQMVAWNEAQTAFIRQAQAHETRVDFGVYRADWGWLATEPASARDALLQELTTQVPRRIRELLDTPLPGLASRAKAWLPGFGHVQRMGDGVTVFFDRLPDARREPELASRFAAFYPAFVKGLAKAMSESPDRHYAINLVMTDQQVADRSGPFDVGRLFDLLKTVEAPDIVDGRIVETNGDYTRHGNVELRFLVLLTEPTTQSKKKLRATIEASPGLYGGDRRIFLRSVVPLLLLPQASAEQYRDDLVYVQDNFGGIGFWPAPLISQQFNPEQQKALRNTFGPPTGSGVGDALCSVVCPNRWIFRLAFELLLLIGAVCWLLLQWNCEWRSRYGRYALLGAIPPLLVGAALLQCDPALEALRRGNAQLIALIAFPVLAALWALLKRKEDKP